MTDQIQREVEGSPAVDVDTQLAAYEQSYEQVRGVDGRAKQLLEEAEPVLHEMYAIAEGRGDERQMELVNQSYDHVQALVNIIGQQGAALRGANAGIGTLKEHRDQILNELNTLLRAMETFEEEDHPKLEAFAEQLRDWEGEYYSEYYENVQMDAIYEMQEDNLKVILNRHLHFDSRVDLHQATKMFCKFLNDDLVPNVEQEELLQKLVDSFLHDERY